MLEKYKTSKFIFVVGIGGSDLASKAVWNAMTLHKIGKKIFFLESPDSREYEEVRSFVNQENCTLGDVALVAISKSGETLETLDAYHKTFDILAEKFGEPISERTVVISTKDSPLWKLAESRGIERVEWEGDVGGRFSAFTVAHTVILTIAGLDTASYLDGSKDIDQVKAAGWAKKIFENYSRQANILDFFFFNSELEDLGKWCRQLIAESLGKKDRMGEKVGLTPTVSIGPVDLHSMLQLDLGGPPDKFTLFVIAERDAGEIGKSAYLNTTEAYKKAGLPFEKYEMPEISERELAKFMSLMILVTLNLADLLGVDPYGQPEVEEYKEQVRKVKSS